MENKTNEYLFYLNEQIEDRRHSFLMGELEEQEAYDYGFTFY